MDEAFGQLILREAQRTSGLVFRGTCDADMGVSTTVLDIAKLGGFGDNFFNTHFFAMIIKNANSAGNAPESEIEQISDYTSNGGVFICDAFTQNVEPNDEVLIIHELLAAFADPSTFKSDATLAKQNATSAGPRFA